MGWLLGWFVRLSGKRAESGWVAWLVCEKRFESGWVAWLVCDTVRKEFRVDGCLVGL